VASGSAPLAAVYLTPRKMAFLETAAAAVAAAAVVDSSSSGLPPVVSSCTSCSGSPAQSLLHTPWGVG